MKFTNREFVSFVCFGTVNTILTYIIYLIFLLVVTYPVAYSITFVIGVYTSYYFNATFVFKQGLTLKKALQYPMVYLIQYVLGLGLLYLLVESFAMDPRIAPIVIVVLTVPITFLLSRLIIVQETK